MIGKTYGSNLVPEGWAENFLIRMRKKQKELSKENKHVNYEYLIKEIVKD